MNHPPHRVLLALCITISFGAADARVAVAQSSALSEATRAFYSGDYARATQLVEKHLRMYPNDAAMRVIWARTELAQGNFAQAFEELQKALATDPKNIDAVYYLSLTARELSHREYQRLLS